MACSPSRAVPGDSAAGLLSGTAAGAKDPWAQVPQILARIVPPTFPERDFDITQYGAKGDGKVDNTEAIAKTIAACAEAGGGRVVVPAGRFLTGPVHLKSRVNLHVSAQATLVFHTDPARYLPAVLTRWEGMEMMGYSPLVYANDVQDVAISGAGTLDGQASESNWWAWKGGKNRPLPNQIAARNKLQELVDSGAPVAQRVFADGSYLRPQFIQFYRSRNILVEGVTILNSPMWEVHPVECTNVTVRDLVIRTHGPNNDGCNPESCTDVLIERCLFDTGDDCIAIKSGRNADGRRLNIPTQNVIVRDCTMKDGHGGVTIGSEISGGVKYVFVERCTMDSPLLERALRFKNNALRGGVLEHVYMRDCTIGEVMEGVLSIDLFYEEGEKGPFTPIVRDVELRNVTSKKSEYALYMRAYPKSEISDIRVIDCKFDGVAKGSVTEGVQRLVWRNTRINGQPVSNS
ncbi:MAG: glycoside hydrolase family 28 protein [Gemmatimonadaceae bacterium]|nr:glycoside hydrolase family 28 protein [Gemmatimonadaceae bacterium]